ncbi:MAG: putative toxin-antitoxin system toxin component, PIN family [Candidatus Eremiobacteraeota bacterium]|nr:putative toxin-antitoxin system toxin component, PIN family [Candidatus Eremiobacteraeota bacterium]
MKVVLDASVLVAAAIAWYEKRPAESRWLIEVALIGQRRYENVTSEPLIFELRSALERNPRVGEAFAERFVRAVGSKSTFIPIYNVPMGARDPRDDKVIETAMNANVDAIVTEDHDLHDADAQRAIAKTGIGIRDRPIQVWNARTLVAALSGRPRFRPLVLPATVAA